MSEMPKYPEVVVPLAGEDGNAFAILARVQRALRRHGVGLLELERFRAEATAGDYDNVLRTCDRWVTTR